MNAHANAAAFDARENGSREAEWEKPLSIHIQSAPSSIRVVTDGRAGIRNQALGLGQAIAAATGAALEQIDVKHIGLAPSLLQRMTGPPDGPPAAEPWPDIWVGCGRASVDWSLAARARSKGQCFVVQLQDPRRAPHQFDLVLPPAHDGLQGPNVRTTLGALNTITPAKLEAARAEFADKLDAISGPRVLMLVGGDSKRHHFDAATTERVMEAGRAILEQGGGLMLTMSRRTPGAARTAIMSAFADAPGSWVWDGQGVNPYFGMLGGADAVVVTEDSVNMLTEACATGKPVFRIQVTGAPGKLAKLYEALGQRCHVRPFDGQLTAPAYEPLRETDRMAQTVVEAWRAALQARAAGATSPV